MKYKVFRTPPPPPLPISVCIHCDSFLNFKLLQVRLQKVTDTFITATGNIRKLDKVT